MKLSLYCPERRGRMGDGESKLSFCASSLVGSKSSSREKKKNEQCK